jgi:hypothetical protein
VTKTAQHFLIENSNVFFNIFLQKKLFMVLLHAVLRVESSPSLLMIL